MNNTKVRDALKQCNLKQWELADMIGMSESALSKKMRYELPKEIQDLYVRLIHQRKDQKSAE